MNMRNETDIVLTVAPVAARMPAVNEAGETPARPLARAACHGGAGHDVRFDEACAAKFRGSHPRPGAFLYLRSPDGTQVSGIQCHSSRVSRAVFVMQL
jgi:hypothetical protein